jgi:hypothetical protein
MKTHLRGSQDDGWPFTVCGQRVSMVHMADGEPTCKKCRGRQPEDPRRSEMRAILQSLEKAWSKTPEKSLERFLYDVQFGGSSTPEDFEDQPDAELLKALEKYGAPDG